MSINLVTAMDVDFPAGGNSLKRSNSAPMINDVNTNMTSPSTSTSSRETTNYNLYEVQPRTRRFSASFSPVPGSPGPRLAPRINQIRQEECVEREVAHERDMHCQMQMSHSYEDLTLMPESPSCKSDSSKDLKMMPLHLNLSNSCQSACSSPSPTRPTFTCFSPATIPMWRTLSPSPSRKQTFLTRRSLSPIAMKQSPLGSLASVKRKLEDDKCDMSPSPRIKRLNSSGSAGLLMAQTHTHTLSPLPGSLSSVGTPESVSSADSPGFTFRPVDSPSPGRGLANTTAEPMNEQDSSSPKNLVN